MLSLQTIDVPCHGRIHRGAMLNTI